MKWANSVRVIMNRPEWPTIKSSNEDSVNNYHKYRERKVWCGLGGSELGLGVIQLNVIWRVNLNEVSRFRQNINLSNSTNGSNRNTVFEGNFWVHLVHKALIKWYEFYRKLPTSFLIWKIILIFSNSYIKTKSWIKFLTSENLNV